MFVIRDVMPRWAYHVDLCIRVCVLGDVTFGITCIGGGGIFIIIIIIIANCNIFFIGVSHGRDAHGAPVRGRRAGRHTVQVPRTSAETLSQT